MRTHPIVLSVILASASMALLGCGASKSSSDSPPKPADVADQPTDDKTPKTDADPSPEPDAEPAGEVVVLGPTTAITVSPGTQLRYSFKSHASVGYGGDYTLDESGAVAYLRTDTDYEQTEAERAGKTGADAATATFVFEAREVGTASLQVRTQFRGTVENEVDYTITVVAP